MGSRQERRERKRKKLDEYIISLKANAADLEPKSDKEFGNYMAEIAIIKCKDTPQEADLIRTAAIALVNEHSSSATAWYFQRYNELADQINEKSKKK